MAMLQYTGIGQDSLAGATLMAALRLFIKEMGLSRAPLLAWFRVNSHIDLIARMPLTSPSLLQTRRALKPRPTLESSCMTNLRSP